jgi:type VI secretion system protein VasG
MADINLKNLIGKLNDLSKRTLESAAGFCLSRTHYNVEIEHWLLKLLEQPGNDLTIILKRFDVDQAKLTSDLLRAVDQFKTGNSRSPALSPDLVSLIKEGWLFGSIDLQSRSIRSGHLICGLLSSDTLSRIANGASGEFKKISVEPLIQGFYSIVADSSEAVETGAEAGAATAAGERPKAMGPTNTPGLDQFTLNLTAIAKSGKIDPVLGRDAEIRQIIDILTRRRQNNPILTGEAGVGKTAVVEGFALRVAAGDVPPSLRNVAIHALDLGLLQAGAGVKGEFENRLKSVINEVKASPTPIVMFIDEAHTMIGAGGGAGQGDAANLLKPALARGELRTIAATTWAEYKKYFEKDAALARRFQVVKVEEPSEPAAIEMMRGLAATLERHHGVRILNEAVVEAVKLSNRYISGRQLPDKSVSLLDTTCARIGLSQSSTPPPVEDCRRRIEQVNVAVGILQRESSIGTDHAEQLTSLADESVSLASELEMLESRWQQELDLVKQINDIHRQLGVEKGEQQSSDKKSATSTGNDAKSQAKTAATKVSTATPDEVATQPLSDEERTRLVADLKVLQQKLTGLQGEEPLVHPEVNPQAIAETVAAWTGIPVGRMVADEIKTVLNLREHMEASIIGQSHALERIAQSIRTSRANLGNPRAPIGVFLLAGTSGVGKTETAITLAELLYGGEQNMTVINMSEFKEEHKVSLLMGSPPGYVGYGEGGVLTEAVRRKPYSVVLLDEMEKAHPGVQDIFYQVFDKGTLKDGEGRDIDFRNTVILMTSNAGTDLIKSVCSDPEMIPAPEAFEQVLFPELLKTFKPAFLGRLTVVPYYPLNDEVMKKIVELKLGKVGQRVRDHYKAKFSYSPELVQAIADRCTEVDTGARNVDHILTRSLLPELSAEFLAKLAAGATISTVEISVNGEGKFEYQII